MSTPSDSSTSLSQVDLGEYIHRMSLPSLSSLTVPQELLGGRSSTESRSNSALSYHDSGHESRQTSRERREQARRSTPRPNATIPPPRTSSQRRERFSGFEGVFGQPSIMSNAAELASPTPQGRSRSNRNSRTRSSMRRDEYSSKMDGLTDVTTYDSAHSRTRRPTTITGLAELSVAEPMHSIEGETSRPQSMVEQVRELAKQVRRSRFSEPNLSPVTRGEFSTPRTYRDGTDERTLAAPGPSVSPYSPRRSRMDDGMHPLSRSISRIDQVEPEQLEDQQDRSNFTEQLYIISYLIFFSIFGTLARIGLKHLGFYPGAPIDIPIIWANFAGCFIFGFLLEDRNLFLEGWGHSPASSPVHTLEKARDEHLRLKKTIPLYIGLTTGFCGSLTSFSSFMLDAFLAMSNNLPAPINHPYPAGFTPPAPTTTIHRQAGYSVAALLAVIILNITVSLSALKFGTHSALFLERWIPSLSFRFLHRILDRAIIPLAWLAWFGTLILVIFPPDRPGGSAGRSTWASETWRGTALIALVLAPLGCILRYFLALKLNSVASFFPLGTFAANVFGTAVLGMAFDLQHVGLGQGISSGIGGGLVGCQVLSGVMDGFCGSLTTVSSWAAEMMALERKGYLYGGSTVLAGMCVMIVVSGSVAWSRGFEGAVC